MSRGLSVTTNRPSAATSESPTTSWLRPLRSFRFRSSTTRRVSSTSPALAVAGRPSGETWNDRSVYSADLSPIYDGMSNLTSMIDRDGKTASYQYDPLNRLTTVTYADNSTVTIQWDAGNRPQSIADSVNGTITQMYDGLDRLIEEQSPQGQVVYTYNLTNPRVQMTVNSNPTINYTFDAANRLTNITQGSNSVTLAPDAANRPGTITYPNGIATTYGFDAANQLLSLNYSNGSTSIGGLSYTYDLAGRRISMSGSLATLQVPSPVSTATYDAASRLTAWGGSPLTYDNNGSLLTSPSGSYGWNARNQLTTSPGAGSYSYDAFGRRTSATVSGTTNLYIYDGSNRAVISNTQILSGAGLDHVYAQVSSTGTTSVLRDGLNDTIALTNSAGTTTGSYSYAPFGATTNSGTSSTTLQYTGREDDGASGLYYNRARYYSPQLSRFISQDPIGLAGGVNTYAYAGGDPITNADPSGLFISSVQAACAIDPGFCAEIMGTIIHNNGAITSAITGDPCWEKQAGHVQNGFRVAGVIASILPLASSLAGPSSRALGRALESSGIVRPADAAAHHIVAGSAQGAAAARAALQRLGIDINDAVNGVFLPA
jgi:RHS repeat-associated protein